MGKPFLYILCGYPFSGKSTLAAEIVKKHPCEIVSVDGINKQRGFDSMSAIVQTDWESTYEKSYLQVEELLMSGKSVIYDGANCLKSQRDNLRSIAQRCGVKSILIYINVSANDARNRMLANRQSKNRPDIREEDFDWCVKNIEEPKNHESPLIYDGIQQPGTWVGQNLPSDI